MEYGCIGEVLKHSFSVEIHALLTDYQYELKEIPKGDLEEFMLRHNFKGINVTIPYKKAVIPYLSEVSEKAAEIGAVNTIVNKNGKLFGYNTDFYGMRSLIKRTGIDLCGKKVLILGSGGTSRTAGAVAKDLCSKEIITVSRSGNTGVNYEQAYEFHSDADIIINTTPVGMYPKPDATPIDIARFKNLSGVIDAVYNPLNTELVLKARERGIKASGGLYMLVAQAAAAAELFTTKEIDKEKTEKVYKKILSKKQNIVLIGMPSSGKTTIGKELAKCLGKEFADTDAEIEKNEGKTISEIFACKGEAHFRLLEKETVKRLSALGNTVIATGGGVIKDESNIFALKQNGVIVFIDRQRSQLMPTADRPLSANGSDLSRLYSERYPLYLKYSDISIKTGNDVEKNTEAILKEL